MTREAAHDIKYIESHKKRKKLEQLDQRESR
jgi:hypothetical protein